MTQIETRKLVAIMFSDNVGLSRQMGNYEARMLRLLREATVTMLSVSTQGEGTMAQKEIEVILTRQLASYLAMPIIIMDSVGTLLFYNESAEVILGRRFEETGELSADEWVQTLVVTDEQGTPFAPETRPMLIALTEQRPTHCDMWIEGLDHVRRHIEITAFPLIGQAGRHLGAVSIFWEVEAS